MTIGTIGVALMKGWWPMKMTKVASTIVALSCGASLTTALAATNLPFGQVTTGSIGAAAQTNSYSFSDNVGDVLDFTAATTIGLLSPRLQLFTSDGKLIASAFGNDGNGGCGGQTLELNTVTLPPSPSGSTNPSGTYIVEITDCESTNTGQYAVYAQSVTAPDNPVALDFGETLSGTIGSATQGITYTLSANANDIGYFGVSTTTTGALSPKIRIYDPSGNLLTSAFGNDGNGGCGGATLEVNTVTFPVTGTYTALIGDCSDVNQGSYSIYAQRINAPSGAFSLLWGQTQSGTIAAAAQSVTYTFSGTTNDVIDLTIANTSDNLSPKVRVYDPTGTEIASAFGNDGNGGCGGATLQLSSVTLKLTGKYVALVGDCGDSLTGSYNMSSQCFGTCLLPAPLLDSVSPTSAVAGGLTFTLTASGSNFVNVEATSVIEWNGNQLSTTWVNTGQMTAPVPAADIECPGTHEITVFTPAPGGGISNPISFSVTTTVPVLQSISPTSATAGGPAFTLTVNGSGFVQCPASASEVMWNGASLVTTYVSGSQLTAAVPASDIAVYGTANVTVYNPGPGGGTSAPKTFTINNPAPVLNSISPSSGTVDGPGFTLTLNGSGFVQSSTVNWNSNNLSPTFVSVSQLTLAIPGTYLQSAGTANVSVTNPAPGGGTSGTLPFKINPATPTCGWPAASPITYGQTLAASALAGGSCTVSSTAVPGTFAWTTSSTVPNAGTPSESVTFTPSDTNDYNAATGSVTVTVNKATPTVSAWPTASPITYGQTLAASTLSGGSASVPGTFKWTTPSTAPNAGSPSESVTFTPAESSDYNTVSNTVTVTVSKATPSCTWPTPSPITYGQTLASSTLTGGNCSLNGIKVAGTFNWTTSSTTPNAGTPSESVTFTPMDTSDLNTVAGNVTVTVAKATPTVSAWPTATPITYRQTLAASTLSGGSASVPGLFSWTTPSTAPNAGSPSESVTFTATDSTDYNTVIGTVTLTVNKATPSCTWPTASPIIYGQTLASSTLSGGSCSAPGTFTWTAPSTAPKAGTPSESVTFTPNDTNDYNAVMGAVAVTVNKATPTCSWPTGNPITYPQPIGSSTLVGGMCSVPGVFAWTVPTSIPKAGTQCESVTFTPNDSNDYISISGTVCFTVNKGTPAISQWPTASPITYGQTLAASILSGGSASVPGKFNWTTPSTAPNAGTQSESVTFTPTDSGDYNTVSNTVTVTVNKATPSCTWPTASAITYDETLASSKLTGGSCSLSGTQVPGPFNWTAPSMAPSAGTQSERVTFTPTDTSDYNIIMGTVSVTVAKATPSVSTWPTASAITYGQTLAASTLSGGSPSVPGAFKWATPPTVPNAGTDSEIVAFIPTDSTDYNTIYKNVAVLVNKATQTIAFPQPLSPVEYSRNPIKLSASAGSGLPVTLTVIHHGPGEVRGDELTITGVGTIEIQAVQNGNANYLPANPVNRSIVVVKAKQQVDFVAPKSPEVYGVNPIKLVAHASSGLEITFKVLSGPGKVSGSTLTITGVGTIRVAAIQDGNEDYEAASSIAHTIVVDKAKLTVAANDFKMSEGSKVPVLTCKMTGFVNGETQKGATTREPELTTKAASNSKPGTYPITITKGTLDAKNYEFVFKNGTLTVTE